MACSDLGQLPRSARAGSTAPTGAIVIVGAGIGGLRAAEALRLSGFAGKLIIVGAETHPPYSRPPLSKDLLCGRRAAQEISLRPTTDIEPAEWRLGHSVVACSLAERSLLLANGDTLRFEGLVVATGVRSRRLALPGPTAGRHVLRDLDDALALRATLSSGARLDENGLDLTDGLVCDEHLRVEGRSGIVAVGDLARFPNACSGAPRSESSTGTWRPIPRAGPRPRCSRAYWESSRRNRRSPRCRRSGPTSSRYACSPSGFRHSAPRTSACSRGTSSRARSSSAITGTGGWSGSWALAGPGSCCRTGSSC
jgi:Pyridine nucleotide-disulphide oxidoreductase